MASNFNTCDRPAQGTSSVYTQTYATADRTHANPTASDPGALTGTAIGPTGFTNGTDFNALRDAVRNLVTDVTDLKQLANAIVDDLQTAGIVS